MKKRIKFTPRTLILDTQLENIAPVFLHSSQNSIFINTSISHLPGQVPLSHGSIRIRSEIFTKTEKF